MDAAWLRYAALRGLIPALAFVAMGYGLSLLQPSAGPQWTVLLGGSAVLGLLYTGVVYFEGADFTAGQ